MKPKFVVKTLLLSMFAGGAMAASSATAPATQPVKGLAPTAASVTITPATPKVGDVVTGAYSYADSDGDAETGTTHQWLRDGIAISGATATTYTTTADDAGKALSYQVTPKSAAPADPDTGVSAASVAATVAQPAPIVDVIDITGKLIVGRTLTGIYTYNPNGGDATDASTMTWKNGGHTDSDAAYELAGDDAGKVLTFEVTAKNGANVIGNTDSIDTATARGVTGGNPDAGHQGEVVLDPWTDSINGMKVALSPAPVGDGPAGEAWCAANVPRSRMVTRADWLGKIKSPGALEVLSKTERYYRYDGPPSATPGPEWHGGSGINTGAALSSPNMIWAYYDPPMIEMVDGMRTQGGEGSDPQVTYFRVTAVCVPI